MNFFLKFVSPDMFLWALEMNLWQTCCNFYNIIGKPLAQGPHLMTRIKVLFLKTYFWSILSSGHSGGSSGTQIKIFMLKSIFSFAQRPINLNKIACFVAKRFFSMCLVDTKNSVWHLRRKKFLLNFENCSDQSHKKMNKIVLFSAK